MPMPTAAAPPGQDTGYRAMLARLDAALAGVSL